MLFFELTLSLTSEDATWILRLAGFLIGVADAKPRIRILGICFGLQILARAFGPSQIIKNPKGWCALASLLL